MKRITPLIFSLLALLLLPLPVGADNIGNFDPFASGDDSGMGMQDENGAKTKASLVSEVTQTAPGKTFTVGIEFKHAEGWHAYFSNTGGIEMPLEFPWELPKGYTLKKLYWPTPHLHKHEGGLSYVLENEYIVLADITTPTDAKPGDSAKIKITPEGQICDPKGCELIDPIDLEITIPVAETQKIDNAQIEFFKKARSDIPSEEDIWDATAKVTEKEIVLSLTPKSENDIKLEDAYFIPENHVDSTETNQVFKKTDNGYTITIARDASQEVDNPLRGILVSENHQFHPVWISATTSGKTAARSSDESKIGGHIASDVPTPEMIAEAAKLYDPSKKINYITLDGEVEKPLTFLSALGLIFVGGFLLNLMPCVFPVLGIKVMGFAQQAGSDPRKIKIHGLVFMAGLVVSMWVLAGVIYILKGTFGMDPNWGAQLTNPVFLAVMIVLLFVFGLNMAGLFEFCTSLTGVGGELQTRKGYTGSFFSGVLTTLIATPCSGPFLGSAMAYALGLSAPMGMLLFTVFALGISVPYVVLAFLPKLINKLPRPGAWMVTFKQLMSFALFATAAYFYQSFAKITGTGGASWLLMAIVLFALATWAYGRFGTPFTPKVKKYVWGFAFPIIIAGFAISLTKSATAERAPKPPLSGSSWYPGVVEQNRAKKRIVWVDYTADW